MLIVLLLPALLVTGCNFDFDVWPMYRGDPARDGFSGFDTSANSGQLKWATELDSEIFGSPAIFHVVSSGIPSYDAIYAVTEDGTLYSFSQMTGFASEEFSAAANVLVAPAIGHPLAVYVGTFEDEGPSTLYSINPFGSKGTEKDFLTDEDGAISGDPLVETIDNESVVMFGTTDGRVYQLDSGMKEQWHFQAEAPAGQASCSSDGAATCEMGAPTSDGTNVYVGSNNGNLYALQVSTTAAQKVWEVLLVAAATSSACPFCDVPSTPVVTKEGIVVKCDNTLYSFNPQNGTLLWSTNVGTNCGNGFSSDPAYDPSRDIIYVDATFGVNAYNASNGTAISGFPFTVGSETISSPAIGKDGTIYFGSGDSNVYAIRPDGSRKWNLMTNGPVTSSPAIGTDGTVYVGATDMAGKPALFAIE